MDPIPDAGLHTFAVFCIARPSGVHAGGDAQGADELQCGFGKPLIGEAQFA